MKTIEEIREEIAWTLYCDDREENQRVPHERFMQPFMRCKEGFKEYWEKADIILAIEVGGEVYEDITDPYMGLIHNVRPKTVRDCLEER